MSVTTTHNAYDAKIRQWKRCRDVIAGRDAVLNCSEGRQNFSGSLFNPVAADVYLPRLSGQTPAEFQAYAERAAFFNATGRTVEALTGLIFAKDPVRRLPSTLERYAADITLTNCNLREFAQTVAEEEISVTRAGILVDYPRGMGRPATIAEAERQNVRPFFRLYKAESIINWRESMINGVRQLSLVVLTENYDQAKNEFESETVQVYRVLDLFDGRYRVRLMNEKGELLEDEFFPRMRGQYMSFIPFRIVGGNEPRKPLLLDLVDTNLAHYRNSADYEHGLHFTGLPTPYVAGVQLDTDETLNVGSMSAWVFPDPAANAGFLEFKGDGLKTLAEALKAKEQRMAVLGARMLADEKRTSEALGTVELRTAGERSLLAAVARDVSDAIRDCLKWAAQWSNSDGDIEFALNTDFGASRLDPQMLTALVAAWQSDAITLQTLFDNLKRGEIVGPDAVFEEYEEQLADEGPSMEPPTASPAVSGGVLSQIRDRLGLDG